MSYRGGKASISVVYLHERSKCAHIRSSVEMFSGDTNAFKRILWAAHNIVSETFSLRTYVDTCPHPSSLEGFRLTTRDIRATKERGCLPVEPVIRLFDIVQKRGHVLPAFAFTHHNPRVVEEALSAFDTSFGEVLRLDAYAGKRLFPIIRNAYVEKSL